MMNKYKFDISWSPNDDGFIATCPEFPGLSAFGKSRAMALAEAEIALKLFIESYLEDGEALPEPETVRDYSGQIRLRLPKSLHGQAAKLASDDGVSLNQYICLALQEKVGCQIMGERYFRAIQRQLAVYTITNFVLLNKSRTNINKYKIESFAPEGKADEFIN